MDDPLTWGSFEHVVESPVDLIVVGDAFLEDLGHLHLRGTLSMLTFRWRRCNSEVC